MYNIFKMGQTEDSQANFDAIRFTYITYLILAVHSLFGITFLLMKVIPLFIYNVIIVILYHMMTKVLSKPNIYSKIYYIYLTEILLHASLATILIGWSYDFMYYTIAMIPVSFYLAFCIKSFNGRLFYPIFTATVVSVNFFLFRILTYIFDPFYTNIHHNYYIFFSILNPLIMIASTFLFSALIAVEVNSIQLNMANKAQKLENQAAFDPLTHFLNRRSMDEKLGNAHRNAIINDKTYSLIMGDIDHFKQFNDTYGHDCGDYVLQTISKIIHSQIRDNDAACRWGGEEFLILINDNIDISKEVAERIRQSIENHEFYYSGKELHVTITFGVVEYFTSSKTKTLIEIADRRLYAGKENGRNQVVYR